MKLGQLMKYSKRNFFLEKSYTECGGDPFLKNQNWAYLWINSLKSYTVCSYCMPSWRLSKYIEVSSRPFDLISFKAFFKNKKRSRTSVSASFGWYLKKNLSLAKFYYPKKIVVWFSLLCKILGNMCILNVC